MNISTTPQVVAEFLQQHEHISRLLGDLIRRLPSATNTTLRDIAHELDHLAGPHIQFEEQILYPRVGQQRGTSLQRHLLDEHAICRRALERLLRANDNQLADPQCRQQIAKGLRTGMEHVHQCGLLVSHLATMTDQQQAAALQQMHTLERTGLRWTTLPTAETESSAL